MSLKTLARSILRRTGFDIVRFAPELNRPFAILPIFVREHIAAAKPTGKPFFFVQIGANDGILDDPLRALILQYHLPGLLIEPLPDIFDKLRRNYSNQPQLFFENVAILRREGTVPIYRVRRASSVPHHWHGIASLTRETLVQQGVSPEQIETICVQGTSLESLLTKHGITNVSLLQIDTEGYDFEIIRSAFDAGIFPDMINYEHCWLVPNARFQCKQMLDRYGYQFVEAGKDTLAVLPSRRLM